MTTYELVSQRAKGSVKLTYDGNYLKTVEIDFKEPLSVMQFGTLFASIPYVPAGIEDLALLGFEVKTALRDNEKIALFCRLYEQYVGIKYKVSASDSGKIKKLALNEKLLNHYFTSTRFEFKGKQSIANLAKYWNELLRDYCGDSLVADYPNHWDAAFAAKLDGAQTSKYWAHLRRLGLKPKKDRHGNVTEWLK